MTRRSPYLIMAPVYRDDSAGIRMLYALRDALVARGYEATIADGTPAPPHAIVVYPETVAGNPLRGQTVVRYILNHPGLLGGDAEYDPRELLFTCNAGALRQYVPSDDRVLCVPVIEPCFRDAGLPRAGACYYVGKGAALRDQLDTTGMTEIVGMTRAQVAQTLQTAAVLYTFDNFSMIQHEAAACGCPVVVVGETVPEPAYQDHIRDFPAQLDAFLRITQAAAARVPVLAFGCCTNHPARLDMALKQSELPGILHFERDAESATVGLNRLLDRLEATGADVAALVHHDMSFRAPWLAQVTAQLAKLPPSWVVAGIIGKDLQGRICGVFHDTRIPQIFNTADIHTFPQPACCFDECLIFVNLKSGFRFDTALDGWDLYGTLCVLQAWERGGTAWIIDSGAIRAIVQTPAGPLAADLAYAQHHCTRSFEWVPGAQFERNFRWLYQRFSAAAKIDTTAMGVPEEPRIFATSA